MNSSCAACHGLNGKGEGPVSAELKTKPSELTLIAKRNDGVFPADVLYRIIDGRRTFRAHGTYEMPVWGFVFRRSDPEDLRPASKQAGEGRGQQRQKEA